MQSGHGGFNIMEKIPENKNKKCITLCNFSSFSFVNFSKESASSIAVHKSHEERINNNLFLAIFQTKRRKKLNIIGINFSKQRLKGKTEKERNKEN